MPRAAELEILYEDNHLLAVNKPAALPTMGVSPERDSLLTLAKQYIKRRYHKPGNVYLGVMSRLDAPVTGVLLLARTSKAAARLSEQFRQRDVQKRYWAVVAGTPNPPRGGLIDWMAEDERHRRMQIVAPHATGAREARLAYQTLDYFGDNALLEVSLQTGRKHQIRVQLAACGHPIFGDRKYGSRQPFAVGIALHARQLAFRHPVRDETIELVAPLPQTWRRFGLAPDAARPED